MKTIEEMEKAVLAYCEEVCPKFQDSYEIEGIVTLYREHGGIRVYNFDTNTMIFTSGKSNREGSIRYHYRLFGLAERDAVAVANQRAQKAIQACADYAQSVYVAKDNTIAELQTRNTALVAAGKALVTAVKVGMPITESIIHQLVEFEKALAANTEKGGVQG